VGGCEDDGWEREDFGGEFGYEGEDGEGAVSKGFMVLEVEHIYPSFHLCTGVLMYMNTNSGNVQFSGRLLVACDQ
jgi:hypothetical protein